MSQANEPGWDWFDSHFSQEDASLASQTNPAGHFIRCFSTPDGQACLRYLFELTHGKALGPDVGDGVLRHLEGQRYLVSYILSMVRSGQNDPLKKTS